MGVDEDGLLTAGAAERPSRLSPAEYQHWVDLLFAAKAVTVGHARTVRPSSMTAGASVNTYHHTRFWREITREQALRFPGTALVSKRQRFSQWISALEARTLHHEDGRP
jgi:hypothetical protein